MSNDDVSNGDSGLKEFEDSGWLLGTLAAVAITAAAVLVVSVWFSLLGGTAK